MADNGQQNVGGIGVCLDDINISRFQLAVVQTKHLHRIFSNMKPVNLEKLALRMNSAAATYVRYERLALTIVAPLVVIICFLCEEAWSFQ